MRKFLLFLFFGSIFFTNALSDEFKCKYKSIDKEINFEIIDKEYVVYNDDFEEIIFENSHYILFRSSAEYTSKVFNKFTKDFSGVMGIGESEIKKVQQGKLSPVFANCSKIKKTKVAKTETKKTEKKFENEIKVKTTKKEENLAEENALANKKFLADLETQFGKECESSFFSSLFNKGFKKGTQEYKDCLKDYNDQRLIRIKKEAEEKKILEKKLANMDQMERIQYQCEKVFNFYKHSKKFKDCTLQVYIAEAEARRIDLEKEVLLAQLESSKLKLKTAQLELEISKANEEAKKIEEAQRVAELEEQKTRELEEQRKVLAKKETNNAKGLGSFLDLISVGLQIYSLTSPTPSIGSGSSVSSAMQCFTSGMFQYCN